MLQTIVRSDWINLNKYSFSNTGLSPSMANFSTMLLLKNICLFNLDSSHFARHYSGNHDRLRLKIKMQISKCKIMENHKVTIWIYIKKWAKTPSANADCCFLFLCLLRCFSSAGTHPRAARNYQFTIYNLQLNTAMHHWNIENLLKIDYWLLKILCCTRITLVHSVGFPHSEISGSKAPCRLPEAYRRLVRPSSAVCAKASPHILLFHLHFRISFK